MKVMQFKSEIAQLYLSDLMVLLIHCLLITDLAERVGFEPTVAARTTTVFETVPFGRSGTSPDDENYSR
jgi:hypothetical protein